MSQTYECPSGHRFVAPSGQDPQPECPICKIPPQVIDRGVDLPEDSEAENTVIEGLLVQDFPGYLLIRQEQFEALMYAHQHLALMMAKLEREQPDVSSRLNAEAKAEMEKAIKEQEALVQADLRRML